MTPEELLEKIELTFFNSNGENWKNNCLELIRHFKSEVCKKQRENCCKAYDRDFDENEPDLVEQAILNAPEP